MKHATARGAAAVALVLSGSGLVWARAQDQSQPESPGRAAKGQPNQQNKHMNCPTEAQAKRAQAKTRQVSGTVLQVKAVEVRGTGTRNLVAMLKTTKNDRRLIVDLGPQDALATSVVPGERIAVEGVVAHVGDHDVLVANRLKDDGKTFQIQRIQQVGQGKAR